MKEASDTFDLIDLSEEETFAPAQSFPSIEREMARAPYSQSFEIVPCTMREITVAKKDKSLLQATSPPARYSTSYQSIGNPNIIARDSSYHKLYDNSNQPIRGQVTCNEPKISKSDSLDQQLASSVELLKQKMREETKPEQGPKPTQQVLPNEETESKPSFLLKQAQARDLETGKSILKKPAAAAALSSLLQADSQWPKEESSKVESKEPIHFLPSSDQSLEYKYYGIHRVVRKQQ